MRFETPLKFGAGVFTGGLLDAYIGSYIHAVGLPEWVMSAADAEGTSQALMTNGEFAMLTSGVGTPLFYFLWAIGAAWFHNTDKSIKESH